MNDFTKCHYVKVIALRGLMHVEMTTLVQMTGSIVGCGQVKVTSAVIYKIVEPSRMSSEQLKTFVKRYVLY